MSRIGCTVAKFAFPCDKEVPCVFAIMGTKFVERTIDGQIKWGDDKAVDPATGKAPLFAKIQTITPTSVKVPKEQGMQRT